MARHARVYGVSSTSGTPAGVTDPVGDWFDILGRSRTDRDGRSSVANRSTTARPMPLEAPVTIGRDPTTEN